MIKSQIHGVAPARATLCEPTTADTTPDPDSATQSHDLSHGRRVALQPWDHTCRAVHTRGRSGRSGAITHSNLET